MRCLAVCQTELAIRMLDEILLPSFEVEFLVESKPIARRLHDGGLQVVGRRPPAHRHLPQGRPDARHLRRRRRQRPAQPQEGARSDLGRRRHARLRPRRRHRRLAQARRRAARRSFPKLNYLALPELFGGPLLTEFSRSLTRLRVQQYQRFFSDADRVLDPAAQRSRTPTRWPAAWRCATCCAARKQTAVIAALQGVTRPENQRMMNLLDIHVEIVTAEQLERLRSDRDGGRAAALLRRRDRSRRPGDRPPSRAVRATAPSTRTSAPTTARRRRS